VGLSVDTKARFGVFSVVSGNTYRGRRTVSKGLGSVERAILKEVESHTRSYRNMPPFCRRNNPLALRLTVEAIAFVAYPDWYDRSADGGYRRLPTTPAQRKAITRALHSFVRKHPQYVLTAGKGRAPLRLSDA
jgi:hypothetical protein